MAQLLRRFAVGLGGRSQRAAAREALLRAGPPHRAAVYALAVRYPDGPTRRSVLAQVRGLGLGADALAVFARAKARVREALRRRRTPSPGRGPRAYVAFLEQRSIVRDFDVQVAQSAMIADPIVDTVTSGAVLDVTLGGITIERRLLAVLDHRLDHVIAALRARPKRAR